MSSALREKTAPGPGRYFDPLVVARLANLELRARHVVDGLMSGIHRSRASGFSVEFEEHRQYVPGDELRHIDWKAFGKFDRYLIKQYEDETNLRSHLLVDASGSMDFGEGPLTKWEYACILATAMAHLLLRQSDAVGLTVAAEREDEVLRAKAARRHLLGVMAVLEAAAPGGGTDLVRAIEELGERHRHRGLVAVFSDLLDDPERIGRALALLRMKGNDVIVFHILDPAELDFPFEGLARIEDVETDRSMLVECEVVQAPYLAILREFLDDARERCRSQGIDYVLLSTAEPLDRALVRFLARRAKRRG
ncbi:MAG: DUF58 domain-containing protein [bacterium]